MRCVFLRTDFPGLPSYQRCLELMPRCIAPLSALFESVKGQSTGVSIIDSRPLAVCNNLRISRHRVFAGIATCDKSSTGWFFGFKLHIAIHRRGELLSMKVTSGNVDDRKPVAKLCAAIYLAGSMPTEAMLHNGWSKKSANRRSRLLPECAKI